MASRWTGSREARARVGTDGRARAALPVTATPAGASASSNPFARLRWTRQGVPLLAWCGTRREAAMRFWGTTMELRLAALAAIGTALFSVLPGPTWRSPGSIGLQTATLSLQACAEAPDPYLATTNFVIGRGFDREPAVLAFRSDSSEDSAVELADIGAVGAVYGLAYDARRRACRRRPARAPAPTTSPRTARTWSRSTARSPGASTAAPERAGRIGQAAVCSPWPVYATVGR